MKKIISILLGILYPLLILYGQEPLEPLPKLVPADTTQSLEAQKKEANAILEHYDSSYEPNKSNIDTTGRSTYYWRITERIGERVPGKPDTLLTGFPNRTLVEGHSVSIAYPGNLGLPAESRIYFEREDHSNFMFFDPYRIYTKSPDRFDFINTKIPYSNLTYQSAGSGQNKEERLLGKLSINFGKALNVGFDIDYLYARGYYQSQSAKHLDWAVYSTYITDRHNLHLFINPADYTNAENGGIDNDNWIKNPEIMRTDVDSRNIPTTFYNTWNRMKSTKYYFNYRYNLGFEKETGKEDEEGNQIKQFIPVSSIIYTFDYTTKNRHFDSTDSLALDSLYQITSNYFKDKPINDSTSYWQLRNTVGLSLREGFSSWAKFDLTAFLTQDFRSYTLMDTTNVNTDYSRYATYIGGEITKKTGKFLRYNALGSFGVLGNDNLGDVDVSGSIETRIPVLKDTASLTVTGSFKNTSPSFYENNFRGRFFWWSEEDNKFEQVQKVYLGGSIDIPHTRTNFKLGVENITDYIYFDETGAPKQYTKTDQHSGNIQILAGTLQQNFKLGPMHWDNQLVYQKSSNNELIPLPELSVYSNLYLTFKIAKVLTIQTGANVYYFTEYNSPTYEPVTQQFRLQKKENDSYVKVGNYPLINAYINCHLKYTRFFIQFYNVGSMFIKPNNYFSLPHYPLDPMVFKFGLSWDFHN